MFSLEQSYAKFFDTPDKILKTFFPLSNQVYPRSILITSTEKKSLQTQLRMRLDSKIFRFYIVKRISDPPNTSNTQILGYACLITRKVKSRNMTALYVISPMGELRAVEIVAFHEPPEYIPSQKWLDHFKGKTASSPLRLRSDIPHISGASLSARQFTQAAKLAMLVWQLHVGDLK